MKPKTIIKNCIFSILLVVSTTFVFAQQTAIPDVNFEQALIDLGYDTGSPDGVVPTTNINTVQWLSISNKNIRDLTGIQDFLALERLECDNNTITNLDVSNNHNLKQLYCSYNELTQLNVSGCLQLEALTCIVNQLINIDISNNRQLKSIICYANLLETFSLINNRKLTYINCNNNNISNLDVSHNILLESLSFSSNNIESIDLRNLTKLKFLDCGGNRIKNLNVSNNISLISLFCDNNLIFLLDLRNLIRLTQFNAIVNRNLSYININNKTNKNITLFDIRFCSPKLVCVVVDDARWSTSNWINSDAHTNYYEKDCSKENMLQYGY